VREREGRGEYLPLDREGEALSRAWRAVAAAAAAAYLLPKKKKGLLGPSGLHEKRA
jgi:hypothetical protein